MERNQVVLDAPRIEGKWDESLTAIMPDGSKQLIWKVNPPAADPTRYDSNLPNQDLVKCAPSSTAI